MVPNSMLIVHHEKNLMKILHTLWMRAQSQRSSDTCKEEERVEGRVDLQPAPNEESFEADGMASLVLAEK